MSLTAFNDTLDQSTKTSSPRIQSCFKNSGRRCWEDKTLKKTPSNHCVWHKQDYWTAGLSVKLCFVYFCTLLWQQVWKKQETLFNCHISLLWRQSIWLIVHWWYVFYVIRCNMMKRKKKLQKKKKISFSIFKRCLKTKKWQYQ